MEMEWDQWIQQHAADGGLLQSNGWAEFQRALGRRVECVELRVTSYELRTSIIENQLPFGQSYVYSPRGPIVENREWRIENRVIEEVKKQFPKATFWRVEPVTELRVTGYELRRVKSMQPATTLIVDLSKTEEELLAQMKQKTRYNIKVAQRHGVAVRSVTSYELRVTEQFFDLLEQTAQRDGFRPHPRGYYEKLLTLTPTLSQQERGVSIDLFGAFHNDQLLAGAIVAFFGQRAYYLHGASLSEHRELMAPYALHWEIMREAKRRGCTKYDFWGVAPHLASPHGGEEMVRRGEGVHSWAGITKFKTGFAPATALTHYPGTFDIVLKPWRYRWYRLAQRLRQSSYHP